MHISKQAKLLLATLYFLTTLVLFFLPGSAFPQEGWMSKIYFDKIVHIGLFALLAVLWCWALGFSKETQLQRLFLLLALYGIAVEVIQGLWVPNRSFDLMDWTVDMIGALAGCWFWRNRQVRAKK